MSAAESPIIYAELLSNIRQISVIASLPSPVNATTRAELSADSSKIRVYHGTSSQEARLPGQVSAPSVLPIQTKPGAPSSLAWRLPVLSAAPGLVAHQGSNPVVPWTASNLVPRAPLSCRRCNQILVVEGKLSVWKDLPSENWAEMMDFWHCHKPHDHGNEDEHGHHHHHHGHSHGQVRSQNGQSEEHLVQRAYGANSSIAAQTSTGLVDLTSFLLAENDCSGLNFSTSPAGAGHPASLPVLESSGEDRCPRVLYVRCSNCSTDLGFYNVSISSVVLFKWQVNCKTSSNQLEPTSSDCLAASLLATLSRSGSAKSVVVPTMDPLGVVSPDTEAGDKTSRGNGTSATLALHVWILNGNVAYASSSRRGGPRSALKLLYRQISQQEADGMLESFSSDVQEVNLPAEAISAALESLQTSSLFLPPGERAFKEWQVGLLDKWVG